MIRLASGSPRRRELLALLDVPFEIAPADVDERAAAQPALAKAEAVARRGEVTLAADTMIELDGERIGKPADAAEAGATARSTTRPASASPRRRRRTGRTTSRPRGRARRSRRAPRAPASCSTGCPR